MRIVVDTNVPIVANGRPDPSSGGQVPSIACRRAAVAFLSETLQHRRVLVDIDGAIQGEYRKHLRPSGEPGIGDRFYLQILMSAPSRVERVELPKTSEGNYVDFPADAELEGFDLSDRKFAALARREGVPVANATDSDWLNFRDALARNLIDVHFICGCNRNEWYAS